MSFTNSHSDCAISSVALFKDAAQTIPYVFADLVVNSLNNIVIQKNNPLIENLWLQATSTGLVKFARPFRIEVCGYEQVISNLAEYVYQNYTQHGISTQLTLANQTASMISNSTTCLIESFSICTDNATICGIPHAAYVTKNVNLSFSFLLDSPVNHTFMLRADTFGRSFSFIPIFYNIYDCDEVPITISNDTTSAAQPWKPQIDSNDILQLVFHNRTATAALSYPLLLRFTDNDTANCPIKIDTVQIDRVYNVTSE